MAVRSRPAPADPLRAGASKPRHLAAYRRSRGRGAESGGGTHGGKAQTTPGGISLTGWPRAMMNSRGQPMSIDRALEVLCCFSNERPEWGVSDLAEYLGFY